MTPAQWNEYQRQADVIEQHEKWKAEQERVKKLAEQSWEGCDGCDENDKNFWMNGFRAGYNTAKPDEILDEEIENAANEHNRKGYFISPSSFVEGAKWYRKQLKKQSLKKHGG